MDAHKITTERQQDLATAVAYARQHSVSVLLETVTFSHTNRDSLASLLARFNRALQRYGRDREATNIRDDCARLGTIRAIEVTWGQKSGWHPHAHILSFLPVESDTQAYRARRRAHWQHATAAAGLRVNQHGYQLDDTNERIANYLAKFGREPKWDVDAELTKWHIKHGHGARLTPFDLLRNSFAGNAQAGQRWREYSDHFHGQRQLHWSHGLRQLLQLQDERTDEAIAQELEKGAYLLGLISREQWKAILANDCRAEIQIAAATGSWSAVEQILHHIAPDNATLAS